MDHNLLFNILTLLLNFYKMELQKHLIPVNYGSQKGTS